MADIKTDAGDGWAANIAQVAAVAVATANTVAAIRMADLQYDIAKGYLTISEERSRYYYDVFVPCENKELAEACSAFSTDFNVNTATYGRSGVTARIAHGVNKYNITSRYCTGHREFLEVSDKIIEAMEVATTANMGWRNAYAKVDALEDRRWSRRISALNRGRGLPAQSVSFAGLAYGIFGRLGAQAGATAMGAVNYLAYDMNRFTRTVDNAAPIEELVDPFTMVTAPPLASDPAFKPVATTTPESAYQRVARRTGRPVQENTSPYEVRLIPPTVGRSKK